MKETKYTKLFLHCWTFIIFSVLTTCNSILFNEHNLQKTSVYISDYVDYIHEKDAWRGKTIKSKGKAFNN